MPGFVADGWERFDSSSHASFPNWLGQKVADAKSNLAGAAPAELQDQSHHNIRARDSGR